MEKVEIKYSIVKLVLNIVVDLVFFVFGFYLLSLVEFDEFDKFKMSDYLIPLVSVFFIYSYGKKIVIEFLNLNRKIIFSKNNLEYDKKIFEWNNVNKAKVISKKEYTSKYKTESEEFYLSFYYKTEKIEIKIDNFIVTVDEINNLLKRFTVNSSPTKSNFSFPIFNSIIGYEEYIELDYDISEKAIKTTEELCKKNSEELKEYCIQNLFTETDKVNFIYYSLSENPIYWEDFLTNEFLRVYEIALNENTMEELFPLLENITIEDLESSNSDKIRQRLAKELDSKNIAVRFKTIELLGYWIDETTLAKNQYIVSKLKQNLKDENWKIRWHANSILKQNNVIIDELKLTDRLKGKFLNQYEL